MLIYIFSLCVYSHYFCALTLKVKLLLRQVRESVIVLYGKPKVYDILSVSVMNVYHINHIYRTAKRFTGISLCKFSANVYFAWFDWSLQINTRAWTSSLCHPHPKLFHTPTIVIIILLIALKHFFYSPGRYFYNVLFPPIKVEW